MRCNLKHNGCAQCDCSRVKRVTAGHTVVNGGGKQRAPRERGVKALQGSVMQGWQHALQPESQWLRSVCWWPANGSPQGVPFGMAGGCQGLQMSAE
jgi:hypothetical protein